MAANRMAFPPIFQYSQSNLQDYVDCKRRFQLRYLLDQQWPAPLVEPLNEVEADQRLGDYFHRLLERSYLGVPVTPPEGPLKAWWDVFLEYGPTNVPRAIRKPETVYSIPFGTRRLLAKFDLLAVEPRRQVVIIDWKTSRHRPSRDILAGRLQTLVYLYVAAEALSVEFGAAVRPSAIKLIYWFVNAPQEPEVFEYSDTLHQAAKRRLTSLIGEIEALQQANQPIWPLTDDLNQCRACNYRSYCERGITAANINDAEISATFNPDDPVPEIEL